MELHGRLLECREGDFGGETVLVDGRLVSDKPLAGWVTGLGGVVSHFFAIRDEAGKERAVEVRWEAKKKTLGLTQRVRVFVDGVDRAALEAVKDARRTGVCGNCGYDLAGLEVVDGEVKCPECGRHNNAKVAGVG
jgi:hypothetical protein